jgi:hypothetical protein
MLKWLERHVCPLYREVRGNQASQSYWRANDRARMSQWEGVPRTADGLTWVAHLTVLKFATHFAHPSFLTTSTSIQSRLSPWRWTVHSSKMSYSKSTTHVNQKEVHLPWSTVMTEAVSYSKMFIPVVQITWCHNSEGRYLHSHRCKNLKSHNYIQLVHKHLPCDSTNTNISNTKPVRCLCHYNTIMIMSTWTDIACQVDNQHIPEVHGILADKHNTWQWPTVEQFLRHIWSANSKYLLQNNLKLEKYKISHNVGDSN